MQQPDGAAGSPPQPTTGQAKKGQKWRKWAVALAAGLLMLAEGFMCLWPQAAPALHHPSLAFGCLLGGALLVLLAIHPLWKEWRKRRPGAAAGVQAHAGPPLPSPFKEAAAFARRRRGQGADEVGGLMGGVGGNVYVVGRLGSIGCSGVEMEVDHLHPLTTDLPTHKCTHHLW